MATSFIGKSISLLSHSDVRYRGILAGLDPSNSTIQLRNVFSMGTENRRPPEEFIAPAEQPYQYIIFRASEVKDIALDNDQPPMMRTRSVHDDPAVIGASGPPPPGNFAPYFNGPAANGVTPPPASLSTQPSVPNNAPQKSASPAGANGEQRAPQQGHGGRTSQGSRRGNANSVTNASVSLEKVERAIGDLRLSSNNHTQRGGRKNHSGPRHAEISVPDSDFDFVGMNERFKKVVSNGQTAESDANTTPSEGVEGAEEEAKDKSAVAKDGKDAYNPKQSFFDRLSSSAAGLTPGVPRGGGGRRGMGKSRREEEREKNVATFGEPGGVGLMGPGAYVGGYGRRGGRGGRRGGGARRNVGSEQ